MRLRGWYTLHCCCVYQTLCHNSMNAPPLQKYSCDICLTVTWIHQINMPHDYIFKHLQVNKTIENNKSLCVPWHIFSSRGYILQNGSHYLDYIKSWKARQFIVYIWIHWQNVWNQTYRILLPRNLLLSTREAMDVVVELQIEKEHVVRLDIPPKIHRDFDACLKCRFLSCMSRW